MRFGLYSPAFGAFSEPRLLARLAHEAEEAGWDGFYMWDHVLFTNGGNAPLGDPWVTLAGMAASTSRLRLGTVVTALPRRRPWQLARETTTLDHLSGGRLTLGVGTGADRWGREYSAFGEQADDRLHGEMLDEGLEVLAGLWSGAPFGYAGRHYRVNEVTFLPTPVQQPRIPVWVAGTWPHKKPFRRAARWDGVVAMAEGRLLPADYRELASYIKGFRHGDEPFDIVRIANRPQNGADGLQEYEAAGVTWWLIPLEDDMAPLDELRATIRNGPPRQ